VCVLPDDYQKVWQETQRALMGRDQAEIDAILGETAEKVYRL
jgi:L-fuconolactonase